MNSEKTYPNVSIIILNYKGVNDTIALLNNLFQLNYPNFNVILIENGSSDNSAERLKDIERNYPDWQFIYNSENLGFAGGCNQGIEIALKENSDFILLLNNDTVVDNSFLEPLVELSKKHNAITGGLIYYYPDNVQEVWSFGGNFTWGAVPGHLGMLNVQTQAGNLPEEQITDWVPGCCMLIPRDVIEKIGGLDEDYFAYVEDVDFCLRALNAGYPTYVTSKSVIHHKVGQATGGGYSPAGRFMIAESSVIFIRKHGDFLKRLKFILMFHAGIIIALIREGLKGNQNAVMEKIKGYKSGWKKRLSQPRKIL